ncbi:MAG: 4-alpha-glucanotransferase [Deltaproteobacteria bacterium]|nr:4-alpha-glucanotransferase [Deltaproteobacteria bacterium]
MHKAVETCPRPCRGEEADGEAAAPPPAAVQEALRVLGIRRLLLGIHDPAFPCRPEEDIGRGSPYSAGAGEFLAFVRSLGFNGVQLGPQGMTSPTNASPYDGTLFSRNPLSLAPLPLTTEAWGEVLGRETLAELVAGRPKAGRHRVAQEHACHARDRILEDAWARFRMAARAGGPAGLDGEFGEFQKRNAAWLLRDGLYEVLCHHYGGRTWRDWEGRTEAPLDRQLWQSGGEEGQRARARRRALLAEHRDRIEAYAFAQFLLDRQHRELRRHAHRLGLDLFGDLQIGLSDRDAWYAQPFVLPGYAMGAPPSRTNPEGQPWNYPVLDPGRYVSAPTGRPGPAVRFLRRRLEKMFREFDGLRVDHPHGLICPWVYRAEQVDPLAAVAAGVRLFASPDHPDLAAFAIPRRDQINWDRPRHADDWVRDLEPAQVARYGVLFDVILDAARGNGRESHKIVCEILSTQPYPIRRVLERCGLGRFRVTQKADLDDPADVYRSENAQPEDWIMLGNHDTPPVWLLVEQWCASGAARRQAAYLAWRLLPEEGEREVWAERVAADAGELVQAKAADLFAGPAGNVLIYFTDLLGLTESYNRPGSVSDDNWSLRIASDFARNYRGRLARNRALNLPKALALALRSRGPAAVERHAPLLAALDRLAGNAATPPAAE